MKFTKLLVSVLLLAAMTSCGSKYHYETVEGDPVKARIYTLDNGLKVYMAENHDEPRIQTYIAVKVGSKNDPAETTGLAHYFEHLMFKGTQSFGTSDYTAEKPMLDEIEALFEKYRTLTDEDERRALYAVIDSVSYEASKLAIPNEYDKLMAAIGASGTNAYTGNDQTVYVENIPSNQIDNWARIQADRFENVVLRGFHTELETIYEEKNMSLTQDGFKVFEALLSELYPHHPYGTQTTLGTQEHLKNPSITNVRNYHTTWYVPNNMAICLSGDFDPDEMIETIDKYFGAMEPNPDLPKLEFQPETPITAPVERTVLGPNAENVVLAWRTGGASSDEFRVAEIAGQILSNGSAGLVDLNLNQGQKVLSAYAGSMALADYGFMEMGARPKQGQSLEEARDLLLGEVAKLRRGEFDETLLTAIVNNRKLEIMNYLDSNYGRADAFVQAFIEGRSWEDMVRMIDRMSAVTKQDVVDFANARMGDDNYFAIYKREGKDPGEQKMSKPALTPIVTNRDMQSEFLKEIKATSVEPIAPVFVDFTKDMSTLKAKSDIELLYKKNETTDRFRLVYVFETGSNTNPAYNTAFDYLSYLGTSTKTVEQLKREFYNIACDFSLSAGSERLQVGVSGLSENMPAAMELLEDLVANAIPDEEILAGVKADILKSRADGKLNQSRNFGALRTYAAYGPEYIANTTLSDARVSSLTSEELLGAVKSLFGLSHRALYFGPMDAAEVVKNIDEHHNVPETLTPVEPKRYASLQTPEDRVLLAQYDAAQIYLLQYSNHGQQFDPAMSAPIMMYNEYFGGGMNSIVFQEMREARGLAYSASARMLEPSRAGDTYHYSAMIATQNDKMGNALDAFDEIIENMPVSENAFAIAKEAAESSLRTERVIKESVLWHYISARDRGIDYDIREKLFNELPAMTLDDAVAFQQEWVKGRHYTYCILGDIPTLDMDKLRSLGPVTVLTQQQIFGY